MGAKVVASMAFVALLVAGGPVRAAEETLADSIKKACNKELTTFCKGVPQGQGRILACLYAFQNRVSGKCAYAVYDASAQLEQAAVALKFAAAECKADLLKYCNDVKVGDGRVKACLDKNEKSLSDKCKDALKQTGIKP